MAKATSRKKFILAPFALLVIFFLSVGACANQCNRTELTEETIAHFTISDEHCVLDRNDRLNIYGTITNNCDVPVSDLTIRYKIYGDDGRETIDPGLEPADEWQLYYVPLNPGESAEFRVSGAIDTRTNGVASFEFEYFSCSFDEKADYKKKEVTGYVTREESEQLVAAAKEQALKTDPE